MIRKKTEGAIVFTAKQYNQSPNCLMLLIYNLKSKSIEQSIEAMEDPGVSKFFFQDHVDYEGGVIVTVSVYKNQVRLFSKIGKKGHWLLKFFWMEFAYLVDTFAYCCSKYNQILFFLVKWGEVVLCDLLDTANFTVIPYGLDELPPQFCFNETGEEAYGHYDQRALIYLYKSMFKSLFLESALVPAEYYTKAQLHDTNLPRQLYRYLNIFSLLSLEANNLK